MSNPSESPEVFDLAKSGLIDFQKMTTFFPTGKELKTSPALLATYFSLEDIGENKTGITTFPADNGAIPVSYRVTSGFIFSHAQYPEECYKWLREISHHPELYLGMPAHKSVLDSQEAQAVYNQWCKSRFCDHFASQNQILRLSF